MLEKLFKVNVHPEHIMIVEEINSVEFTVVMPDKLSDFMNVLVRHQHSCHQQIFFKSIKKSFIRYQDR